MLRGGGPFFSDMETGSGVEGAREVGGVGGGEGKGTGIGMGGRGKGGVGEGWEGGACRRHRWRALVGRPPLR